MDERSQKNREFRQKIVDRIASDRDFREQLVNNPQEAMKNAGFASDSSDSEVSGYFMNFNIAGEPQPIGPPVPVVDPVPDPVIYDPKNPSTVGRLGGPDATG